MKVGVVLVLITGCGVPIALLAKACPASYKAVAFHIKKAVQKGNDTIVDAARLSQEGGLTAKELEKEKRAFTDAEKDWLSSFAMRVDALSLTVFARELAEIGSPFYAIWTLLTDVQLAALISFVEFKVLSSGQRIEPSTLEQLHIKAAKLRSKLENI